MSSSVPALVSAPGDGLPDARVRGPRWSMFLWIAIFLAAVVLFSRLRTLPHLFLVSAFVAWCSIARLRRAAVVVLVAVVFLGLEVFLPFDVSTIDGPGGVKVARVVSGKPTEEALAAAARGEVVLGGCLVRGIEPRQVMVW